MTTQLQLVVVVVIKINTAQILLPEISTSLEPSKMPTVEKGWGEMTRLLKKCKVAVSKKFKLVKEEEDVLVSCWHKAVKLMEIT
jgi:hypothetical protein